mgnify:CR=1 FL=1
MPKEIQEVLDQQIPITRHMGVRVVGYDESGLSLEAPLAPNINDKGTAFAGSLGSLVTLAGWGLLHQVMSEHALNGQVAIVKSATTFDHPVRGSLHAHCIRPSVEKLETFVDTFKSQGRARIDLECVVREENQKAVSFTGTYAAY